MLKPPKPPSALVRSGSCCAGRPWRHHDDHMAHIISTHASPPPMRRPRAQLGACDTHPGHWRTARVARTRRSDGFTPGSPQLPPRCGRLSQELRESLSARDRAEASELGNCSVDALPLEPELGGSCPFPPYFRPTWCVARCAQRSAWQRPAQPAFALPTPRRSNLAGDQLLGSATSRTERPLPGRCHRHRTVISPTLADIGLCKLRRGGCILVSLPNLR